MADLQRQADRLDRSTRPPISLYFGGGTPSLAAPSLIERIVSWVHRRWQPPHLEVTLEANPTVRLSATAHCRAAAVLTCAQEASLLRDFRLAGVNRLSLGVQSLRDASLKALGRTHTASMASDALAEAARVFPDHFTFDLIYGRPHETSVSDWRAELAVRPPAAHARSLC